MHHFEVIILGFLPYSPKLSLTPIRIQLLFIQIREYFKANRISYFNAFEEVINTGDVDMYQNAFLTMGEKTIKGSNYQHNL